MTLPLVLERWAAALAGPVMAWRAAARVPAARRGEKRGRATLPRPDGPLIWIHAASVGESLSVLPLVTALRAAGPAVLVTTGTATSAALMAERLPPGALHQFAPLDSPAYLRRFLRHWRPDLLVCVESELWPVMLTMADRAGIPRALVNARLSAGSLRNWQRFPATARRLFAPFRLIAAQTPEVAQGLAALGARAPRVTGDMKAVAAAPPADPAVLAALRATIGARPVWAAVSTHPGEEEAALAAHAQVRQALPEALLILCPRHPDRGDAVAALAPMTRRSQGEGPSGAVWLTDTLGETGLWYRLAPVTFLGGSLSPAGGHNPWEAARCGTAILHGPQVPNAAAAYAALDAAGAAATVSAAGLGAAVLSLLRDPERARAMAQAGMALTEAQGADVAGLAQELLAIAD